MTTKSNTVEVPAQNKGEQEADVVELKQSALTKVKVFLSNNKRFFVGTATGLVLGVVVKVAKDRLASDEVDETPES